MVISDSNFSDQVCLFHPMHKCSSLAAVFHDIIQNKLNWIKTIFIEGHQTQGNIDVSFPHDLNSFYSFTLTCFADCTLSNTFSFYSRSFSGKISIIFQNVQFRNALIISQNVELHFCNVSIRDTLLTDKPGRSGEYSQSVLVFVNTTFQASMSSTKHGIAILHSFNMHMTFSHFQMEDTDTVVKSANCLVQVTDSSFHRSFLHITTVTSTVALLSQVLFEGEIESDVGDSVMEIRATKLGFNMNESTFENTFGAIHLEKSDSGMLPSWIHVQINNSNFTRNRKSDSGAALDIVSLVSQSLGSNSVSLFNCHFLQNEVHRTGFKSAYGGALSIQYLGAGKGTAATVVVLTKCNFTNNKAEDGGGAAFLSSVFVTLHVLDSIFQINDKRYLSSRALTIFSKSKTFIVGSRFICKIHSDDTSLLELQMTSSKQHIPKLSFTIDCFAWHKLSIVDSYGFSLNGGKLLQKFVASCIHCPHSFYIPMQGAFQVTYSQNDSGVQSSEVSSHHDVITSNCISCPFGGDCPGNALKSKPNFWGYKTDDRISFIQCPVGFCCSNSENLPCLTYNQCSGNRTGTLCGSCNEGYTVSLMSNNCIRNDQCDASWFWFPALMSALLYMLWYTFKGDILQIPQQIAKKLCKSVNTKHNEDKGVEKGYFGILTYFVQAASSLKLSIHDESNDSTELAFQRIHIFVGLLLSIELTYVSFDMCPYIGFTTTQKMVFKFAFLVGIYLSWIVVFGLFVTMSWVAKTVIRKQSKGRTMAIKLKFVNGLVEIIKYTYSGFASISFLSLNCISVASTKVWFYDGGVLCWSTWQTAALVLSMTYVVPFPFMMPVGLKLLQMEIISPVNFILGCIVPLPFFVLWCFVYMKKAKNLVSVIHISDKHNHPNSCSTGGSFDERARNVILTGFQGAYRSSNHGAQYWESVMILRRLLLGATALISNSLIHLSLCCFLSALFHTHHMIVKPFLHQESNTAESLSLLLLILASMINLVKATYVQIGTSPGGSSVDFLRAVERSENVFIIVLLCGILCLEVKSKFTRRRSPKEVTKNT